MSGNTLAALVHRDESAKDEYGNQTFTETFTVLEGIYWPADSSEATAGQDQVRWHETVCLPTGTDVSAIDAVIPRVLVDANGDPVLDGDGHPQGTKFEVDGQPAAWPATPMSGWSSEFAVVIQLGKELG